MQQVLTNMWQRLKISVLFVTHDIDEAIFLSDRVYCMTARPGTIKAEIVIPLERPRHQVEGGRRRLDLEVVDGPNGLGVSERGDPQEHRGKLVLPRSGGPGDRRFRR